MSKTILAAIAAIALACLVSVAQAHGLISIPPEAALGLALAGQIDLVDIKQLLDDQGKAWGDWRTKSDERLTLIEKIIGRPGFKQQAPAEPGETRDTFFDVQTKRVVPVLSHNQRLADLSDRKSDSPSVGRLLRGIVLGGRADDANELADERKALGISVDPSGGYAVSGSLSAEWIDALRAQMVLSRAGARTVPMDTGSMSMAKVLTDPTVAWHAENASLGTGDPTLGAVNLNAKTCVCLVRLSLELSQDSANIEEILVSTINRAMAAAIDSAGLNGVSVNAAAAPDGVMNLVGRNTVTSIGAPTSWDFVLDGMYELLLDNAAMKDIGALIAHPAVWKKMAKLKTGISSDKTTLVMPAEVAALPKLWTTAAPLVSTTAAGVIADWRQLLFGVRKDINVRILSEAFMGSNLQLAVLAYSRVDFAATRAESFCTLEGITV